MDYKDVVEFLFTQYPSYQTKGVDAYKPDLSNIEGICEILDNPQKKIKTIHVAGTNGKGSVCNILYNLYKKAGYKVGLFTSPHLIDFRERIIVGEDEISKEYVVNFYKENLERFKKISPSFFEWSTALAFCYFKDSNTEINIIETGLGGRLDSTNIIQPELSIITSIGLDHVAILGDTLEKIAKEKAGIIKENTPTLLGEDILEESVFREICNWKNSKLHKAVNKNDGIQTSLPNYQIKNWNTAKKATEILKNKFKISEIEDDPKPVFAQYNMENFGIAKLRMIRVGNWKMVKRFGLSANSILVDELYDLNSDPSENNNLISHPDHQTRRLELNMDLQNWMIKIKDPAL